MKLIGATAHLVTRELDSGPIIEQLTARVSHRDNLGTFRERSQSIEKQCLALAVEYYVEVRFHQDSTFCPGCFLVLWKQYIDLSVESHNASEPCCAILERTSSGVKGMKDHGYVKLFVYHYYVVEMPMRSSRAASSWPRASASSNLIALSSTGSL